MIAVGGYLKELLSWSRPVGLWDFTHFLKLLLEKFYWLENLQLNGSNGDAEVALPHGEIAGDPAPLVCVKMLLTGSGKTNLF